MSVHRRNGVSGGRCRTRSIARCSVVAVAAVAFAGCTRAEDRVDDVDPVLDSSPVATTTPPTTEPPPTTAVPTSTSSAPPTTTPPTTTATSSTVPDPSETTPATTAPVATTPPTTAAPVEGPDDLTLAADGILPLRFGAHDIDVVPVLRDVFGPPVSDRSVAYPVADDGLFVTEDGEEGYIAPYGRTVCWSGALCADFGAGAPETLIFTGWSLGAEARGGPTAALATEDGLRVGATLDDVDELVTYDPAQACFQVAYGFAAGVEVELLSDDGVFAAPNPDGGGIVVREPDPTEVVVTGLSAGERPFFLFADC